MQRHFSFSIALLGRAGLGYLLLALLLSGCVTSRYLPEGQYLLERGRIKAPREVRRHTELDKQFPKKRNRRFLYSWWIPNAEIYYLGLRLYKPSRDEEKIRKIKAREKERDEKAQKKNTKKRERERRLANKKIGRLQRILRDGNALMRISYPLVLYDSLQQLELVKKFERHLRNRGYLDARVIAHMKRKGNRVYPRYEVKAGTRYVIDSVSFFLHEKIPKHTFSLDNIRKLILDSESYDYDLLEGIREELYQEAQNNGLYAFSREGIDFKVHLNYKEKPTEIKKGASRRKGNALLWLEVLVGAKLNDKEASKAAETYHWSDVTLQRRSSTSYARNLPFNKKRYWRILGRRILPRPNQRYNKSDVQETKRMLLSTDLFRLIEQETDTIKTEVHTRFNLYAHRPASLSGRIGLEVRDGSYPSPYFTAGLKLRNAFGLLEVLEPSVRLLLEGLGAPQGTQALYQNFEFSVNFAFRYPALILPWAKLGKPSRMRRSTSFNIGFIANNRQDYLRYRNNLTMDYEWRLPPSLFLRLRVINISLISARLSERFEAQIRNFENSFSKAFQSALTHSIYFSARWQKNYVGFSNRGGIRIEVFGETGGHVNQLYQSYAESLGLAQFHFSRLGLTYVQRVPLHSSGNLVWRLRTGIVIPHDRDDRSLFYESYFFSGGSNENRAWPPRRLGPGRLNRPGINSGEIEQPGEFVLAANLEYRFRFNKTWQGATFVDASNVWFTSASHPNPKTHFLFPSSLLDLAVGTGVGIRVDLSFFILRIDIAAKVFDPAKPLGERFVLDELRFPTLFTRNEGLLLNIGINYPF